MDNQEKVVLPVGINETNELVRFLCALANAIDISLQDGKINYWDFANFLGLIPSAQPAIDGIKMVPAELKDLTPIEREMLRATVATELRLSNPITEGLSEKAAETALHLAEFISMARASKAKATPAIV